jgi:hypothetical protein
MMMMVRMSLMVRTFAMMVRTSVMMATAVCMRLRVGRRINNTRDDLLNPIRESHGDLIGIYDFYPLRYFTR